MPGNEYQRYPNYKDYQKRLDSYGGRVFLEDLQPENLASAGLFYAGQQDWVKCFSCGIGLRNFEAGDDPWIMHTRYSSKCTFIRREKDEEFINAHAKHYDQIPNADDNNAPLVEPCKMCHEKNINTVFIPCSHIVTCGSCAPKSDQCLMCKAPIHQRVRVHLS